MNIISENIMLYMLYTTFSVQNNEHDGAYIQVLTLPVLYYRLRSYTVSIQWRNYLLYKSQSFILNMMVLIFKC